MKLPDELRFPKPTIAMPSLTPAWVSTPCRAIVKTNGETHLKRYLTIRRCEEDWMGHRLSFVLNIGPINGLVLHHCDNKWCVEPSHLYLGTKSLNALDAYKRKPDYRANVSKSLLGSQRAKGCRFKMPPEAVAKSKATKAAKRANAILRRYGLEDK